MPDMRDVGAVIAAAESAAAAGDYESAERFLGEAAELQEASLGPLHPDLANTLNNLGIVSEMLNRPEAAEACFRRAYAIAIATLAPDHPFVETSRKNLEDFCLAQGKPVSLPPPPVPPAQEVLEVDPVEPIAPVAIEAPIPPVEVPATPAPPAPVVPAAPVAPPVADVPVEPSVQPRTRADPVREKLTPAAPAPSFSMLPLVAIVVILLLLALFAMRWFRAAQPDEAAPVRPATSDPGPRSDAASQPDAAQGAAEPPAVATAPVAAASASAVSPPRATAPAKPSATSALVADAKLCRTLSTSGSWRCAAPNDPVSPGPLFFYTRIKVPVNTTVQHRWYRGGELRQAVQLRIRANTSGAYRTYSRTTVDGQRGGEWRVELRTMDGALLHEERFVVR